MRTERHEINAEMTAVNLETARLALGMNKAEMASRLRTPYRTYQDWEAGRRRIPGICQIAVELLLEKDARVMQAIDEKISSLHGTL